MANSRFMNAKFNGRCNQCDALVKEGDRMFWVQRGVIECLECAGDQVTTPANETPAAQNKLDASLEWDATPPSTATPTPPPQLGTVPRDSIAKLSLVSDNTTVKRTLKTPRELLPLVTILQSTAELMTQVNITQLTALRDKIAEDNKTSKNTAVIALLNTIITHANPEE